MSNLIKKTSATLAPSSSSKTILESSVTNSNQANDQTNSLKVSGYRSRHRNVLDEELDVCSMSPLTGFTRTGYCETNSEDFGTHLLCAKVTKEFLEYTKSKGNDLSSPNRYFPGLKPGDNWCLCVSRWVEAYKDGFAPPPVLNATHHSTLNYLKDYKLNLNDLKRVSS